MATLAAAPAISIEIESPPLNADVWSDQLRREVVGPKSIHALPSCVLLLAHYG